MIAHVVLFEPRADLGEAASQKVLEALELAASSIPSVRRCRVGRRIRHGLPGYEQIMRQSFEYAAIIEFDDAAGLEEYLTHPVHATIGEHFHSSAAAALAYDYELSEAPSAFTLLP